MIAQNLFDSLGGTNSGGFPAIHSQVFHTPGRLTPYLKTPGVVMLSKPQVDVSALRGFLEGFGPSLNFPAYLDDPTALPDSSQLCKTSGQTCYMSFGERRTKNENAGRYFENLLSAGHGSVLEHANFSFLLYGISRSVTHELVRHRHLNFSQVSQRYVSGSVLRFVERPEYQDEEALHEIFFRRIERVALEHEELLSALSGGPLSPTSERKKVNQTARSLLPNETEAPMVLTGNVRALRHVIEMRASEHAESEIRNLALRMFLCLLQVEPILFGDYELMELSDGSYEVSTKYRKV